jgi:hypothetical protein
MLETWFGKYPRSFMKYPWHPLLKKGASQNHQLGKSSKPDLVKVGKGFERSEVRA